MAGPARSQVLSPEADRTRLALLVRVAAAAGQFSPSLADAVQRSSEAEVRVMTDLVDRGMNVPELVSVLQGAHVIVGDDALYQRWIFPTSRKRLSSHHRDIDKRLTPDYAIEGPLVRESLHGKAFTGTWVQLERSTATFAWGRLPSWSDLEHLRDYLVYRATGLNVGPWGLSALVDTRPMLLRPQNTTRGRLAHKGLATVAGQATRLQRDPGGRARVTEILTSDVEPVGPAGACFRAPRPGDPVLLLPTAPYGSDLGEGLFGSMRLARATSTLPSGVVELLDSTTPPPAGTSRQPDRFEAVDVPLGDVPLTLGAAVVAARTRPLFIGIEEDLP